MAEYGMIAFGRSGNWELSIDEHIGESDQWSIQIESPHISLQCSVMSIDVIRALKRLLDTCDFELRRKAGSLHIGLFYDHPVTIRLDSEYMDRCFITVGDSADARFEATVVGEDYVQFRTALSQVVNELESS